MADYIGKLYKVGSIIIKINIPYTRTEYKTGKIKSIENINLEYFANTYQNNVSEIEGKFKRMSGKDDRVKIWFDKKNDASSADEIEKLKSFLIQAQLISKSIKKKRNSC